VIIPCQRQLFSIPEDIAYLNLCYMSPLLKSVRDAGLAGVDRKSRPWNLAPVDFFTESEDTRGAFARLIGATADDIAFVPSASYGLAVAAANIELAPGARIIALREQFPSNVFVWQRLAEDRGGRFELIERPADHDWTAAVLAALDTEVAVVALPQCHWTDGGLLDLVAIGRACRAVGAQLVLDVTQSAGALPLPLAEVDPDYLIAASYKWLLGPYSSGFLYVAPRHQAGRPLEENWIARRGSEGFSRLIDYQSAYQPGARRFDVGERANFALMPMVAAALRQIETWGIADIAESLGALTDRIASLAADLGFEAAPKRLRGPHMLGLRKPGLDPDAVAASMQARQVYVSIRGDSIRVSPHLHVSEADIERFEAALRDCA
jgi:selenocysteine lyase/cysteine desulfurase